MSCYFLRGRVGDRDERTGRPNLLSGCYRVGGVLAVARAVGDSTLKPFVSGVMHELAFDSFIIIAFIRDFRLDP